MNKEVLENIATFLDKDKKVVKIPKKRKKMICVMIYLADKFEQDKEYKESEVNEILEKWNTFGDYATLRRTLCDLGFLSRDKSCSVYKLSEEKLSLVDFELWIKGQY